MGLPSSRNLAFPGGKQTHHRFEGGGLARAVATQQGHQLTLAQGEGDFVDHLQVAVSNAEVFNFQHFYSPAALPR